MKISEDSAARGVDEKVERILGAATPRQAPSPEQTDAVRQSVQAEWQKVTGRRQVRRRWTSLALAASVLIAVFAAFNSLRAPGISDIQVAVISKTFGSIYVLGERAELLAGDNLNTVFSSQILITDAESGVALEWGNGGSLRIDADTRLEFVSDDTVYLHSGRVYFDSQPNVFASDLPATIVELTIQTEHGAVAHVGTQYMTQVEKDSLIVSVREGEVMLGAGTSPSTASGGEQLLLRGNGNVNKANIKTYGANWQWTEQLAPQPKLGGRSIDDFLQWVKHETGLELEYENAAAKNHAIEKELRGDVNSDPLSELRLRMLTAYLDWRVEDGFILIQYTGGQEEE